MVRELVLTPIAMSDLENAETWYESQQLGLGTRFSKCVTTKFTEIQSVPHHFPIQFDAVRIAVLKPFPYLILFEVDNVRVTVLAVYHSHRDPQVWKQRS